MSDTKMVQFTPEKAKRFASAYNKAKKDKVKSFFFEGDEYVVSYAYYVLEYLKMNSVIKGVFTTEKIFIVK